MNQPNTAGSGRSPIRWKGYAGVMVFLALAFAWFYTLPSDVFYRSVALFACLLAMALATVLWFAFRAGFTGYLRLAGWAVLVLCAATCAMALEFRGWQGDMWPDIGIRGVAKPVAQFTEVKTKTLEQPLDLPPPAEADDSHDYPGFLGSDRLGVVRNVNLARDWQANPPKELWRKPVGLGWSAFAIKGRLAVTQEQRGAQEAVVCYDLLDGQELWVHVDEAHFREAIGGNGPRATPTISGGRVFALGAEGMLNCLDAATGKLVWGVNILTDATAGNITWGMSGSPLVFDDLVVVNPGGLKGASVVAYDRTTGKSVWRSGSGQAAYSSPLLTTVCGLRQILVFNGPGIEAYAVDGAPLWSFGWVTNGSQMINVSQPLVLAGDGAQQRVFISSGYSKGCALLEISRQKPESATDSEPKPTDSFNVKEVWSNRQLKAKFTNTVERNGFVYGLDEKILCCMELATGEKKWKERAGQYDYGQIILVGDDILVQAESGEVALVEATPERFHEWTRFQPLTNKTWNNPALAGRYLLVRNDREAACYELPLRSELK
jgi:outer membrane protein assembly factor BamB